MHDTSHPVRFVRALVFAAAMPACSSAPDATTTEPIADPPQTDAASQVEPAPIALPLADAATVDTGYPKTSGPIVPPETV
jgi:hypothetical protein